MKKSLFIIDGTAQLYRSYYAIKPLTDPQGRQVNVVFGFAQILFNLLAKYHPTHLAVVFDRPEPTHRHLLFPEYKAQREETPEGLVAQIPLVKALLTALQLNAVEQPGWEADDLMATLAQQAKTAGFAVSIFTNDKDLFQLVDDSVRILRPLKGGEYEILDAAGVEKSFGVKPEQVVDALALMGDASDNIPGVAGVGPKTAIKLIQSIGTLDDIFANLAKVGSDKLRETLKASEALARTSRQLAQIRLNPGLTVEWENLQVPDPWPESAQQQLLEFGFRRLLASIQFAEPSAQPASTWTQGMAAQAPLAQVVNEARSQGRLAIELWPEGVALAASTTAATWVPLAGEELTAEIRKNPEWAALLTDSKITKISYDLKPVMKKMLQAGQTLAGPYLDLHLAAHLLDLPATKFSDFVSRILGGAEPAGQPGLLSCALLMIADNLIQRLQGVGSDTLYQEIELPLVGVLADIEATGVAVDVNALQDMSQELGREMAGLEKEVQDMAGRPFNLRSPQQLAEVLFTDLGLTAGKKTKTGHSTSIDVLEDLAAVHPLPQRLLEYRQLQKLKSTYLDVLPGLIDPADNRVHTTFHQVGAATGRLSSSDPNLQNIPIRSERGRLLRKMFVPGQKGFALLSADYSQIELRLLAHLSADRQMIADFSAGLDIHRATAAEIFGVELAEVTPEMRRQAKTCNFGIAYGVSPFGLSRQLRVSVPRAKTFIDGFYARYPQVRQFLENILVAARQDGFVATFMGRRRAVPEINSANRNVREAAERMAINTPIQGAAADIIKKAMIAISRELPRQLKSRMILQVHDELLFEGPLNEMPELQKTVERLMRDVVSLSVPLLVESAWGDSWGAAHE